MMHLTVCTTNWVVSDAFLALLQGVGEAGRQHISST
jgi:hypothetical protein